MSEIEKINTANLLLLLQFVGPGFLIVYFRSMFITRRQAAFKDNVVFFIFVSVIYALIIAPFAPTLTQIALTGGYIKWLIWVVFLTVIPILTGIIAGVAVQKGWLRDVFALLHLQPVSPFPTGWDWTFSKLRKPTYMIVTLESGDQIAGLFGPDSLAASDLVNKDLFLEEIFDLEENIWKPRPVKQGILISGKAIRHIEFIGTTQESQNVQ